MRDAFLRVGTRTVASLVFLLLVAGALVTSTESGLAVPDWPLSYGKVMPPMVGGILFEHGHRLIAAAVSTLVGIEFGLIFFFLEGNKEKRKREEKERRTLRLLSGAAFGAILLQALLGGMTVLFLLPPAISSAHAALAEIVFALTVVVALMCSRTWADLTEIQSPSPLPFSENPSPSSSSLPLSLEENIRISSKGEEADRALRWVLLATGAIYVQIVLGAVMRHTGAGLAIPDFPTSFGGLVPSAIELSRPGVGIHLAHRLGALVVVGLVAFAVRALSAPGLPALFLRLAALWTGLVAIQLLLGALSVWSRKAPPLTVAHLGVGALCWVTGVVAAVCLQACRNRPNAISSAESA